VNVEPMFSYEVRIEGRPIGRLRGIGHTRSTKPSGKSIQASGCRVVGGVPAP
jgi:hypothetical protein